MEGRIADAGADMLASGVHDAKNRLFEAQTLIAQAERERGVDLPDARLAIVGAAARLSNTLVAYRLLREQQHLSVVAVPVAELAEDALLAVRAQCERSGIAVVADVACGAAWPLDRTLLVDVLVNALQNACRHARAQVRLDIRSEDGQLRILVNDDGPGYAAAAVRPAGEDQAGLGLFIAGRIARLHRRRGAAGSLVLRNGGPLGGALFELRIP